MQNLKSKDWERINHFLLRVGSIITLEDFSLKLLSLLKELVNFDRANCFVYDQGKDESVEQLPAPLVLHIPSRAINDYIDYYQFRDEIKARTFNTATVTRSTDIMDYHQWKKSEYFTDFLKPNGIYYSCGFDLHYRDKLLGTVSLFRDEDSIDFSPLDIFILEMLRPHIANHLYKLILLVEKEKIPQLNYSQLIAISEERFQLSPRERDVVELLVRGKSNEEIADNLYISVNTVKKHLYKIFTKTGASSRTEVVARILEVRLLEGNEA